MKRREQIVLLTPLYCSSLCTMAFPPPNSHILSLVSALSSPENHALHIQAIQARDEALIASFDSLCWQLALLFLMADHSPSDQILSHVLPPAEVEAWHKTDAASVEKLRQQPAHWVPFGQMAGLILKNALTRPPMNHHGQPMQLQNQDLKEALLQSTLSLRQPAFRSVSSSILATCAVSEDAVQPVLHVHSWPELIPRLNQPLQGLLQHQSSTVSYPSVAGSLQTLRKCLEDAALELGSENLDAIAGVLVQVFQHAGAGRLSNVQFIDVDTISTATDPTDFILTETIQSLLSCIMLDELPNSLLIHWNDYLHNLLAAAQHSRSVEVLKWSCRSLVTLLELHPSRIVQAPRETQQTVIQTFLTRTSDPHPIVALEACEIWTSLCGLDDEVVEGSPLPELVRDVLPHLIPVLLQRMVYSPEEQEELVSQNELAVGAGADGSSLKPIFHKSKAQQIKGDTDVQDDDGFMGDMDDDDDDDDGFEDGGNAWTLRKCAAASLDSLASLYDAELILPTLLPLLEQGMSNNNSPGASWAQEACILALGAIAEGCIAELTPYLGQLHPHLLQCLSPSSNALPQLQGTTAWTLGRYASWTVETAQESEESSHLLARQADVLLQLLVQTPNSLVQISCCSSFGVLVEASGDMLVPFLEPIYRQLVVALQRLYPHRIRSLLMLFDVFAIMGDTCGAAIGEGSLPSIYVPPLLEVWNVTANHDQKKLLLPLMEALASISVAAGPNFQPYAMQSFENAMATIEQTTLQLAMANDAIQSEEDFDPIVCGADLLDGLVEGLGVSFGTLITSSARYGPQFLSVLLSLCNHEAASIRMSSLALLGDVTRKCPTLLESALPQLLKSAVASTNPQQNSLSVCTNAVWAVGEICVRCQGNPNLLQPIVTELVQNLLSLLTDHVVDGLVENSASCVGRLALANPKAVASELPRLLPGWMGALGQVVDPGERRDGFKGFLQAVYANPHAISEAARLYQRDVTDTMVLVLDCITTWHFPRDVAAMSHGGGMYEVISADENDLSSMRPFPEGDTELRAGLLKLVQDMKMSVGDEEWQLVQRRLSVRNRTVLREYYAS